MGCNPELAVLLDTLLGTEWRHTGDVSGLLKFADDDEVLEQLAAIKDDAKQGYAGLPQVQSRRTGCLMAQS